MPKVKDRLQRRGQHRQPFTASALVYEPKSETRLKARTTDLAPDGCFIDTLNPFAQGTMVKVRIDKGGTSFEAWAKIVYSLASMGMGLVFHFVEPEQLWVLHEWLGDTGGVLLPKLSLPAAAAELAAPESLGTGKKKDTHCEALSQLVTELMARGLIGQETGDAILGKLNRCPESE
jgi:hypothetical protein